MPTVIRLDGPIPSKKNSRINTSSGRSFPSKRFSEWQTAAIWSLRQQTRDRYVEPVSIHIDFVFGNLTPADIDNRISSILDMLVKAMVITDDNWKKIPQISARSSYEKNRWSANIVIEKIAL